MAFIIVVPQLSAAAMALYPFILVKRQDDKTNAVLINHEKIHLKQQLELLIAPFYFFYLFNYLINVFKYASHHQSYLNIVFEKEAYANEHDLAYLSKRRCFAWLKWMK